MEPLNTEKRPYKKFVPSICKPSKEKTKDENGVETEVEKPAEYEGFVELWAPSFEERRAMLMMPELEDLKEEASRIKNDGGSDRDVKDAAVKAMDQKTSLELMKRIAEILPRWTKNIQIRRLEDDCLITKEDQDAFEYDSDLHSVTQEMCGELLGKFKFGNPKTPQS